VKRFRRRARDRVAGDHASFRRAFYEVVNSGDRAAVLTLAKACVATAPDDVERRRWSRWVDALNRRGGRVKVSTFPIEELLVGEDLAALDAARELLGDDEQFEEARPT
jgi:hypothetical protein